MQENLYGDLLVVHFKVQLKTKMISYRITKWVDIVAARLKGLLKENLSSRYGIPPQQLLAQGQPRHPLPLITTNNSMIRLCCWRHLTSWMQDREKPVSNQLEGFLLAGQLSKIRKMFYSLLGKEGLIGLPEYWRLYATVRSFHWKCAHWCNNSMTVMG